MKMSRNIWKSLLCALCFCAFVCTTKAQEGSSFDEPFVLEQGMTYDVSSYTYASLYAAFTAPYDGVLSLSYYNTDHLAVYVDTAMSEEVQVEYVGTYPSVCDIDMTEGTTYYFYRRYMLNADSILVEYSVNGVSLELVSVSPGADELLSAAYGYASLNFNRKVESYETATASVGSQTVDISPTTTPTNSITFNLSTQMKEWYDADLLDQGSEIVIELTGVTDQRGNLYGGTGVCKASFTAAAKVVTVIEQVNTPESGVETFFSYYRGGEESKVVLRFDGDIDTVNVSKAKIQFGDLDKDSSGGYYQEELPIGCPDVRTVEVDLSGKLRRVTDMLTYTPTDEDYEEGSFTYITLKIPSIMAADGQYIYTGDATSMGSFSFVYLYEELFNNDVATDFSLDGSDFDSSSKIEIWLRGYEYLSFSGVTFIYVLNGDTLAVTVSADELTIVPDPDEDGAELIYVTIPEFDTDAGTRVSVSFADLLSDDGLDYSSDLSTSFKTSGRTTSVGVTFAEKSSGTVYSLDGVLLPKGVETGALKKGVYIVDGKKKVLK